MLARTNTRTHVLVGFANPYLRCQYEDCGAPVPYWHNPDRCNCTSTGFWNSPCGHKAEVVSICYSWGPVDGCQCTDKENHDRKAA